VGSEFRVFKRIRETGDFEQSFGEVCGDLLHGAEKIELLVRSSPAEG
jgi:hypothetical protein